LYNENMPHTMDCGTNRCLVMETIKTRGSQRIFQPAIDWLLSSTIASIRYQTRRDLMGQPEWHPAVRAARQGMRAGGPVAEILAHQSPGGNWINERSYYTPKYISSHWSMLLLDELQVDGGDSRLQQGCRFMLTDTQSKAGEDEFGFSCFWGNLLHYTVHGGYHSDRRLGAIIQYLAGDVQREKCRCPANGGLPCAWGMVRALWGMAALPKNLRNRTVNAAIAQGIKWLLEEHDLMQANYPTSGKVHPLWFRLNFPLFYQVDILFTLRVLAELGALDHPGAQAALDWLANRRTKRGRWRGASPYRRRTWEALADPIEVDRWVSLQALTVLKRAGRIDF